MIRSALLLLLQFGQDNFLSESALEAIQAGRAEVAATLIDLGEACRWAVMPQVVACAVQGMLVDLQCHVSGAPTALMMQRENC